MLHGSSLLFFCGRLGCCNHQVIKVNMQDNREMYCMFQLSRPIDFFVNLYLVMKSIWNGRTDIGYVWRNLEANLARVPFAGVNSSFPNKDPIVDGTAKIYEIFSLSFFFFFLPFYTGWNFFPMNPFIGACYALKRRISIPIVLLHLIGMGSSTILCPKNKG